MIYKLYSKAIRFMLAGMVGMLLITSAGCVPDNLTDYDYKQFQPPSTLPVDRGNVFIGEQEAAGLTVALYIDKGAHTGYNRINVMLKNTASDVLVNDALITLEPAYTLNGEDWEVPVENPTSSTANEDGFFEGAALFLPPQASAGAFLLTIAFDVAGAGTGQVVFPLEVEESIWMQRVVTETGRYYVSWIDPARPIVGQNAFEVDLHRETVGGYEPVDDVTLDLYPYMNMGGGDGHSTPYDAPVHLTKGRYRGAVDFIMAGGWEMTVYVDRGNASPDTVKFIDYTVYQGGAS